MNKKEVLEIKKQFHPNRATISTICGCYVNSEKQKLLTTKTKFATLSEEEQSKYFEIFKKSLTGKIEKNLINISFSNTQEKDDGCQNFLMKLKISSLQDATLLEELYDKIIESYDFCGNYYITLAFATYDIPAKGDEIIDVNIDAINSTDVYKYIICAICPVNLTKPALAYNQKNNNIEDRIRDWVVEMPQHGFLFPAFNNRNTDIHNALLFKKKDKDAQHIFVESILGAPAIMSAKAQSDAFKKIVETTLGHKYTYEIYKNLQEDIQQRQLNQEISQDTEPITFSKNELKELLENNGIPSSELCNFDMIYDDAMKEYKNVNLTAENIIDVSKSIIKTADISINIKPDSMKLVSVKNIDGKKCIVIVANNDVIINGIQTNL